ncbi:MAG: energy transducer TonB [Candidatus Poribacteria bacterium]|nr:energy transducer TonB [Candidatus Poribacteria bacterium]MDE0504430.1 energy transducer TonB [Candidatus Poribacteria bacterium]
MKSGQSNSTAHLGTMRQRRVKRIKRQRAIEIGKQIDVSLKTMALNSVQKKELSGLQLHSYDGQEHQVPKRSRLSVLVSLSFHAIAVFIAAFYVARTAQVDDEAVSVDFFEKVLEKRDPPKRESVVKPKPLPTEPLKPIVLPVPKVPVRPITSGGDSTLGDTRMESLDNPGLAADPNVNTGGLNRLDSLGPIRPPTVNTEDPTDMFRKQFEDEGLGDIGEPPDFEDTPDPDLTEGDAFKPTEILRPPSFRYKVEPKYPSEARRAGKEGKVILIATIDVDGKAKDIEVKEDNVGYGCARAAKQALRASRFNPAKRGDEIVAQRITVPYTFTIED